MKWQEFWDAFESTIHNNERLRNVDRFNYLRVQLVGQAREVISGLDLTNENYGIAVKLLHERYGKKQLMLEAHYAQLLKLDQAQKDINSLRTFYDKTEKHLRVLQSLGEDTNHRNILSIIRSKFPGTILGKLAEMKQDETEEWTVEGFQKKLQRYISAQEEAQHQLHLHSQEESTCTNPIVHSLRSNTRFTGEALLSSEIDKQKSTKRTYRCIFCEGKHWSDECQQYPDLITRKEKLKRRCFICLRNDHMAKDCKSKDRLCIHCGERNKHHRSLCPKKFGNTIQQNQSVSEKANITTEKDARTSENSLLAVTDFQNENIDTEKDQGAFESSLVAIDEKVFMQTALVTAKNNEKYLYQQTRAILDTGSQRSYVTKELADNLKLKSIGEHTYSVYTFGNKKPKKVTAFEVQLTIKTRMGNDLDIKASVVPQITGLVERTPLNVKDANEIQRRYHLADTLPTCLETSPLGILIGNNYYNDIMMNEKEKIHDGLYLLNSRFGWILSGRILSQYDTSQENESFAGGGSVVNNHE